MAEEGVKLLCSSSKIERDQGILELGRYIKDADSESVQKVEKIILSLLEDQSASWETKHGALMGTKLLVSLGTSVSQSETSKSCSDEFSHASKDHTLRLLEDGESRVRLAAGEVMGVMCMRDGPQVFASSKDLILEGVRTNLERQVSVGELSSSSSSSSLNSDQQDTDKLMEKLVGPERKSSNAEQIFHDTAGWKALETWMKCLQGVIDGCGPTFNTFIDQDLLDLIFTALTHTNRFVRETGFYVCASLVACNYQEDEMVNLTEENAIYRHGHLFAEQLSRGLADNWSQVRLAASVATRQFLMSLPVDEVRQTFYPLLLPPMCLNRYYVAEGVRIYNQDTWRQVAGTQGKAMVEKYIKSVVDFYISQTEADNHAVREAACACIAELGSKIDADVVRPYVPQLLDALLVCFKDESWPVRDASCVACGNFVLCFPEEAKPACMGELFDLFYENLQDNIPSVRQGAAIALANVVRAYGSEAFERVLSKITSGLEGVEKQPENTEKYSGLDKGPATYGVVKKLRDNDMDLHTNKQMYSCGSLAPKMHRGRRDGGCMDHNFRRPTEPWEVADGCVELVAELSSVAEFSATIAQQLPLVAKSAGYHHYTQHVNYLETMCKKLPVICKGIGKRPFKMYLEMFFDVIFYALSCDNALTSTAAGQCLQELGSLLGPNILKGRVEQFNPRYVQQLETHVFAAPL